MIKVLQAIYILITCLPQLISIARKAIEMIDGGSRRQKVKQLESAIKKAKEADTRELEDLFKIRRSKNLKLVANMRLKPHGLLDAKKVYGLGLLKPQKKKLIDLRQSRGIGLRASIPVPKPKARLKTFNVGLSFSWSKVLDAVDQTVLRLKLLGDIKFDFNPKVVMQHEFMLSYQRGDRHMGLIYYDDGDQIAATHAPFSGHIGRHGRMKSGIIPS